MKLSLKYSLVFAIWVVVLIVLPPILSSYIVKTQKHSFAYTPSIGLNITPNEKFDIAIMGLSNARVFCRGDRQDTVSSILNKNIINFSVGGGKHGMLQQKIMLQYLLKKHIQFDTLLFFITPVLFYERQMDINDYSLTNEPLDWDYLTLQIQNGSTNKWHQIYYYIQTKLSFSWWNMPSDFIESHNNILQKIDSVSIQKGIADAMPEGLNEENFNYNAKHFEQIVSICKKNNIELILIQPPAAFGAWPGNETMLTYFKNLNPKLQFIDSSQDSFPIHFFYDHHHFNKQGVIHFTQKYLEPIFSKNQ